MARFWPIYVVFLVTFLVSIVDSATTVNTEASPKNTYLEKLNEFISLVSRGFQSIFQSAASRFNAGTLRTDKLNSSVLVIKQLERLRKPVATKPQPEFTTSPLVVTTPAFVEWKMAECGDQWTKYGSSLFSFCTCTEKCSIESASYACSKKQAELAKCSSPMHENLFQHSLKTDWIFLGGSDRDEEETWRWPDGSLLNESYTNWMPGQPNGGKWINCMVYYRPTLKWFDDPCDHLFAAHVSGFVCEKEYPLGVSPE